MARFHTKSTFDDDGVKTGQENVPFTVEEEAAQDARDVASAKDFAANSYKNARQAAYPPIGDQLDALWKGGDAESAMKVIIDKVKSDNPKPGA